MGGRQVLFFRMTRHHENTEGFLFMQRLEERVRTETLLCDGGMGTQLHAYGLAPGECPELWCLDKPEIVKAIHRAYRDAGSLIVETRHLDQADAEERVERQARAFELRKPYLVERWNAAQQARPAGGAS